MSERAPKILTAQDVIAILKRFAGLISDNAQNLCKLDSIVGDGDHGTTIKRGTVAAQEAIDRTTETNIDKLLLTYSMALLSSMGGASGPVFGSLFQGMGLAARDRAELDKAAVVKTFEQALEKVTALGKAEEGDKTLVQKGDPPALPGRHPKFDSSRNLIVTPKCEPPSTTQGRNHETSKEFKSHAVGV